MNQIYSNTFTIQIMPYFDRFNKCYKNILTFNQIPNGPLGRLVRRIQYPKLSKFQQDSPCYKYPHCIYTLIDCENDCSPIGDKIQNLTSFLLSNGYQIETQITNMLQNSQVKFSNNKLVLTATYYGHNQPNITYMR